jgi:hypothetical protein
LATESTTNVYITGSHEDILSFGGSIFETTRPTNAASVLASISSGSIRAHEQANVGWVDIGIATDKIATTSKSLVARSINPARASSFEIIFSASIGNLNLNIFTVGVSRKATSEKLRMSRRLGLFY